jgi:hypothetical protein
MAKPANSLPTIIIARLTAAACSTQPRTWLAGFYAALTGTHR